MRNTVLYLCLLYTFVQDKRVTCLGLCFPFLTSHASQDAQLHHSHLLLSVARTEPLSQTTDWPAQYTLALSITWAILANIRGYGQEERTLCLTSTTELCGLRIVISPLCIGDLIYKSEVVTLHSWQDYWGLN